jgi:uncharacterized protein (TIGR02118 family)
MHKVVILIEPPADSAAFEERWPDFLHQAEAMPGLRREASSRVLHFLFGATPYAQMHELFFDSFQAAQEALASPPGRSAGVILQELTRGRMAIFFAEHHEDSLENLRPPAPVQP